jgi:activator of 2-hydroxyglutaryl-CoA dehydratase
MTHLANKGEDRSRILAGLFDAICENVQVLVKAQGPARMVLAGGVGQSQRVRDRFRDFAERREMRLLDPAGEDDLFLDAIGCAVIAARAGTEALPPLEQLFSEAEHGTLERRPPLAESLHQVRRLSRSPRDPAGVAPVVLGLDIGSTGSKAVAVDVESREPVWEAYVRTSGDPVGAAQALVSELVAGPARERPVVGVGVTGSGREIVRSLMATCYGSERVFVVNEIAAHAEGARAYDPRVDTIFEIGGQDAKYIRLQEGRIVDAAMNEACSAGTGSFIEEQGRRLGGLDAAALAKEAIAAASRWASTARCSWPRSSTRPRRRAPTASTSSPASTTRWSRTT